MTQTQHPQVSILIPVYNREKYLEDCIQSALDQTFTDIEVVVVDNASTDGTWAICQRFAARDERVRIFRNAENVGPVRNWLRCVSEARGAFSKILFSDDKLAPDCIEQMWRAMANPNVAFAYSAVRIGPSEEESELTYQTTKGPLIEVREYVALILQGHAPYSPGAILLRTDDLRRNLRLDFTTARTRRYADHGAGPDLMISLLTLMEYRYAVYLDRPLVFFRAHCGSISILNTGNEVQYSYWSVISLFLKEQISRRTWLDFLAFTWLLDAKRRKQLLSVAQHLRDYEGCGSRREVWALLPYIITHASGMLVQKIKPAGER